MNLRRRRPAPAPCPCRCGELARRLAEHEDLAAAITRTVVALRPRQGNHSIAAGLIGWGVESGDAGIIAAACQRHP